MTKVQPITPAQVTAQKQQNIPDAVFEAFNELIAAKWDGRRSVICQDDVVRLIRKKMNAPRTDVFAKGWLDVEPIYQQAGWKVEYDKPGYNEDYPATFTFSK